MSIFVIFRVSEVDKVKSALVETFPNDHLEVDIGQFLVSSNLSAEAISEKLKITDGINGNAIVFAMGSYYGRASTNIWDWIKAKAEKSDG
jgi:hypothetical protein